MTAPRYELKYWCDDATWAVFLAELGSLITVDPHAAADRPWYTVTSLYFDTDDLAYFYAKIDGLTRRGKVRLRRYDRDPTGFVELKAKKGRLIVKHRVSLDAAGVTAVAHGDFEPLRAAFRSRNEAAATLLSEVNLRPLLPTVITRYERSAYMLVDDPAVRITLDRSLACHGRREVTETFLREDVDRAPMRQVGLPNILEVKFTGSLAPPIRGWLQRHGFEWRSISKYCYSIEALGLRPALPVTRAAETGGKPDV